VRLGFSVAPNGTGHLVNEIWIDLTRDHFSSMTGSFALIPKTYAKAFSEVHHTRTRKAIVARPMGTRSWLKLTNLKV
jgi:hypothetical protein